METTNENAGYVSQLSESLVDEIVGSVGLPKNRLNHWVVWKVFHKATHRLAEIGVTFEKLIREEGLPAASRWVLSLFCHPIRVEFQGGIPSEGPLLIVANHPGAYDALMLFSQMKRKDIRCIATEIPFIKLLPTASDHFIFAPRNDSTSRMIALRQIIRHLQSGGAMVYFPSGHRDPDPVVYKGMEESIHGWLPVFNTFYDYIPGLKILPAIASGIVSQYWANHPLTLLRRKQIDKHRLAEFGQVITQLLNPGKILAAPALSFGQVISQEDLQRERASGNIHSAVISQATNLLHTHTDTFGCRFL